MLIEQVCCAIGNGAALLRLVSSRRSQDFERAAKFDFGHFGLTWVRGR